MTRMKTRSCVVTIATAGVLIVAVTITGGCKVGPDYQRPATTMPTTYASTRPSAEATDLTQWWTRLDDPTLNSLIQRATEANLDLAIAAQRVREARAQRRVVAGAGQPQVNADGSYQRARLSENSAVGAAGVPFNSWIGGFDASWEMDIFGGLKRQVESADAVVQATIESQRDVLVTVQAEVATNYVELRSSQARLDVVRRNLKTQTDLLDIVLAKMKGGLGTDLEVSRSSAQVSATQAQIPTLESSIKASTFRIAVLLGLMPGQLVEELASTKVIPIPPMIIPAGQPGELLQRRPDIRQAERQLAAATANIGVAKADLYPKFSLVGTAGLSSSTFRNWWDANSRYWSLGPTVSWSILNGGTINANIEVQNARQQQALLSYQQTILQAVRESEEALTNYANEQVRREQLQNAVNSSRRAVDLAQELYTKGITDFTGVLDAQRTLLADEEALVLSQAAVAEDAIAVYKALGGGWQTYGPAPAATQPATTQPAK
jgi:NodT family efflux transporter outer membrane factor (OMF) lipoprotein